MSNIAVFISGKGSLLSAFKSTFRERLKFVVASRECEGVTKANELSIPVVLASHLSADFALDLISKNIKLICLAGYLKIVPSDFIKAFNEHGGKIINSHPSLIPAYCGKKFYGDKVHQAVLDASEKVTGFTIHEVTQDVDAGPILFQKEIVISPNETVESLKNKIQKEEKIEYVRVASELAV